MSTFRQLREQREARNLITPSTAKPQERDRQEIVPPQADTGNVASSSSSTLDEKIAQSPLLPLQVCSALNPDLQVKHIKGKGRGLFWCPSNGRKIGRGTTLLRVLPEVTVPSSESLHTMCHVCFTPSKDGKVLQRCSGCKMIRYCSITCQKADWQAHKQECKALQAFQRHSNASKGDRKLQREPGMTVRLMARLIWGRKRSGWEWWTGIENLQSNRAIVSSDESLAELPLKLAAYLGADDGTQSGKEKMSDLGFTNASELLDTISRTIINTFVVYTSDLTAVGVALSSSVAMINHSCSPNVAVVYPNGPGAKSPMHVVAIKDLEPGDELTTFYIDVSEPYHLRQKTLQERYSFKCSCSLCVRSERNSLGKKARVDAREAIWCSQAGCSGWVASPTSSAEQSPRTCTICKLECTWDAQEVREALEEGQSILGKVDTLMDQGNMRDALDVAQPVMKTLTRMQPPSAYPLSSLLRQLQTALIMCATSPTIPTDARQTTLFFEEAIRFHFLSIAGMQASHGAVFDEGHPSRAISLATLSTLLIREATEEEADRVVSYTTSPFLTRIPSIPALGLARDRAGISLMLQAIKELKIAYGSDEDGGEPGRKLIEQVREWKEAEVLGSSSR
ncbi:hypothetical protein CBS101457_005463 [Exobasidium rhododendri]|nr:hypothetical protein CBS101457_005463 [Exobasidium rhododendri]